MVPGLNQGIRSFTNCPFYRWRGFDNSCMFPDCNFQRTEWFFSILVTSSRESATSLRSATFEAKNPVREDTTPKFGIELKAPRPCPGYLDEGRREGTHRTRGQADERYQPNRYPRLTKPRQRQQALHRHRSTHLDLVPLSLDDWFCPQTGLVVSCKYIACGTFDFPTITAPHALSRCTMDASSVSKKPGHV